MEEKIKKGRKPVPKGQKKKPVTIWVKEVHVVAAKKDVAKIETKYEKLDTP